MGRTEIPRDSSWSHGSAAEDGPADFNNRRALCSMLGLSLSLPQRNLIPCRLDARAASFSSLNNHTLWCNMNLAHLTQLEYKICNSRMNNLSWYIYIVELACYIRKRIKKLHCHVSLLRRCVIYTSCNTKCVRQSNLKMYQDTTRKYTYSFWVHEVRLCYVSFSLSVSWLETIL